MQNYVDKIQLSENALFWGSIDYPSMIDFDKLENHILSYKKPENLESNDIFAWRNYYYKTPFDTQMSWVNDYVLDHVFVDYKKSFEPTQEFTSTILEKNESLHLHTPIDIFDLQNSPDLVCMLTVSDVKNDTFLMLEYEDGRRKDLRHMIKLERKKFIMFSSNIKHRIIKNNNDNPLVNLCIRYKYI